MVTKLNMANGCFAFCEDKHKGQKATTVFCCNDWDVKTALSRGKKDIPKGSEVEIKKVVNNFYGEFLLVTFEGVNYNLKAKELEWKI